MDKTGLIYIKPVEGRGGRHPVTMMRVPPEGMFVPAGEMHWAALLRFGDIEQVEPPADREPRGEPSP